MHLKANLVLLLALVALVSTVHAQIFPPVIGPTTPPASPAPPKPSSSPSVSQPGVPPPASNTVSSSSTPSVALPTPSTSSTPAVPTASGTKPKTTTSTNTVTTTTSAASPTPTETEKPEGTDSSKLATAGIVVGSVVVAAAIGIWVFRKWKLSPSRDFQSKIRGDDYSDYPRTYESDTVHLRQMDQTPEPAAMKSPYSNAQTAFPTEDQYYDPNYANKDQSAAYSQGGATGYGQQGGAPTYDQNYGGYNDHGYGHGDYTQGQAGYNHGPNDYAQSQVGGYGQGGYAQSNVGGGYQHGYEEYGRR